MKSRSERNKQTGGSAGVGGAGKLKGVVTMVERGAVRDGEWLSSCPWELRGCSGRRGHNRLRQCLFLGQKNSSRANMRSRERSQGECVIANSQGTG